MAVLTQIEALMLESAHMNARIGFDWIGRAGRYDLISLRCSATAVGTFTAKTGRGIDTQVFW